MSFIENAARLRLVLLASGIATLTACGPGAIVDPEPQTTAITAETLITSSGAAQQLIVRSPGSPEFICNLPAPDASISVQETANVSIGLGGVADRASGGVGVNEASLGGRTTSVLIAREMYYRTCEFSRNYNLSRAEAMQLFRTTMHVIAEAWVADAESARATPPVTTRVFPPVTTAPTPAPTGG